MNKTADAIESVATLIAGIEMMGGAITELVAKPGNVSFRVGNGLTGYDIRMVLDALGLDFENLGATLGATPSEIIVRTGTDVETVIKFSLPYEYMGNCAPHGTCAMAASIPPRIRS